MFKEVADHLHPILVHFPIVLITVGLVYDVVVTIVRRSLPIRQGLWLWLAAALGAWLAVATGPEEDARGNTSYIEIHSTLADFTAWIVTLLVLGRLFMLFRGSQALVRWPLIIYLALSVSSVALVLSTGYYGGKMVYDNGVGVKTDGKAVNPPIMRSHE